jgi:heme-degrading monooxygenase HmoA
MYAVIFEVEPDPDRVQDYLDLAASLRPELEKIDGFISIERFTSLSREGKILSLSFWRDEEAIGRWRQHQQHHKAQLAGRNGIFWDYRLCVAAVVRDYGMDDRRQAPQPMPQARQPR